MRSHWPPATGSHRIVQGIYGRLDVLIGGAGVAGRGVDIAVAQHLLGGGKASRTVVKRLGEVTAQIPDRQIPTACQAQVFFYQVLDAGDA